MDADSQEIFFKDEVYEIVNCALEVSNEMGHGLHEKPYENSLVIEFRLRDIPFRQQAQFPILYKGHTVSTYIPDLIAYEQIVVDTKVIDRITAHERGQVLNYLRITGCKVGLILNFNRRRLEWERLVL